MNINQPSMMHTITSMSDEELISLATPLRTRLAHWDIQVAAREENLTPEMVRAAPAVNDMRFALNQMEEVYHSRLVDSNVDREPQHGRGDEFTASHQAGSSRGVRDGGQYLDQNDRMTMYVLISRQHIS